MAFEAPTVATVLVTWLSEVGSIGSWLLVIVEVHVSPFSKWSLHMMSTVSDMQGSHHISLLVRFMQLVLLLRLQVTLETTVTAILAVHIPSLWLSITV